MSRPTPQHAPWQWPDTVPEYLRPALERQALDIYHRVARGGTPTAILKALCAVLEDGLVIGRRLALDELAAGRGPA